MRLLAFTACVVASTATAAPFLGSRDSFVTSTFCKTYICKHVATVPSGSLDQFHYDVAGKYRVVVWRYPSDPSRVRGSTAVPGQVRDVATVWYGVQDTPFGSEGFVGQLVTFATGKTTPANTALSWLDASGGQRKWGNFYVWQESVGLPGANAAMLTLMTSVDPFR